MINFNCVNRLFSWNLVPYLISSDACYGEYGVIVFRAFIQST